MSRLIWDCISVVTMLAVSINAACPSWPTVIDLCDSNVFGGNNFYIDSARMAEGHHQCSCTLSTNDPNSIEMVEVTKTTFCRSYWYNATVSLGQDLDTFTYEYQEGSCVFPDVWGHLTYSSIPWSISITRRRDGLSEGGEGDPGVCMHVFSVDKTAIFMKCGNTSDAAAPKVLETRATSSASLSTTSSSTDLASTSTTAASTSIVSSSTATESMLTPAASTSTTALTSTAETSTSASAISTSTASTSTSTATTSTSSTTSATSGQVFGSDTVNTSTTAAQSTLTSSASTTTPLPASHETLDSTLDIIAIGASVAGLIVLILLVTLCVFIGHKRWKTYTRKDVENVVYVTDNIQWKL